VSCSITTKAIGAVSCRRLPPSDQWSRESSRSRRHGSLRDAHDRTAAAAGSWCRLGGRAPLSSHRWLQSVNGSWILNTRGPGHRGCVVLLLPRSAAERVRIRQRPHSDGLRTAQLCSQAGRSRGPTRGLVRARQGHDCHRAPAAPCCASRILTSVRRACPASRARLASSRRPDSASLSLPRGQAKRRSDCRSGCWRVSRADTGERPGFRKLSGSAELVGPGGEVGV
jgi:hypothetical protein